LLSDSYSIDRAAITACYAAVRRERLTRLELRSTVLRLAASLRRLRVRQDDRVVAVARHSVEAVVAALATAAIGAVFSSCAPDMGNLPFYRLRAARTGCVDGQLSSRDVRDRSTYGNAWDYEPQCPSNQIRLALHHASIYTLQPLNRATSL